MKQLYSSPTTRQGRGNRKLTVALAGSLALFVSYAPMADVHASAKSQKAGWYGTDANPFAVNDRIARIADAAMAAGTDTKARIQKLFDLLQAGGPEGVQAMSMDGKPPRTAVEVLQGGGDCTDLANLAIAAITEMNRKGAGIKGGAMVVHFNNEPPDREHMVPYVIIDGKEVKMDLQASTLGAMGQGEYTLVMKVSFKEAPAMYHREAGDFFMDSGKPADAVTAYEASLKPNPRDAYVRHNLGVLYEKMGDKKAALENHEAAAARNGKYAKDAARLRFYVEYENGTKAYGKRNWDGCIGSFTAAGAILDKASPFDSGHTAQQKAAVEQNIGACQKNKGR